MEGKGEQAFERPGPAIEPISSSGRDPSRAPAEGLARPADLALAPLEDACIYRVLPALSDAGWLSRSQACRILGGVSHATTERHLRRLCELGIVERSDDGPRGSVLFKLTEAGRDYRPVLEAAERCLGPVPGGDNAAASKRTGSLISAIRTLWRSQALKLLMLQPLSIADLSARTTGAKHSAIRRALLALRVAGLVETRRGKGRSEDHWITERAYAVAGVLLAAYRWERLYVVSGRLKPLSSSDILAVMAMLVSRLRADELPDGTYTLLADLRNEPRPRGSDSMTAPFLGMAIDVRNGSIRRYEEAWGRAPGQLAGVEGDPDALLDLAVTGGVGRLAFAGKKRAANRLAQAVHRTAITGPDPEPTD